MVLHLFLLKHSQDKVKVRYRQKIDLPWKDENHPKVGIPQVILLFSTKLAVQLSGSNSFRNIEESLSVVGACALDRIPPICRRSR